MIMDAAIVDAMKLQDLKNYVIGKTPEELQTLIDLAKQRVNKLDQEKEAKYMDAINKAIQDYLDNIGDLTFHVEYEDADGQDAETEITVNNLNSPVGSQGTIYI